MIHQHTGLNHFCWFGIYGRGESYTVWIREYGRAEYLPGMYNSIQMRTHINLIVSVNSSNFEPFPPNIFLCVSFFGPGFELKFKSKQFYQFKLNPIKMNES